MANNPLSLDRDEISKDLVEQALAEREGKEELSKEERSVINRAAWRESQGVLKARREAQGVVVPKRSRATKPKATISKSDIEVIAGYVKAIGTRKSCRAEVFSWVSQNVEVKWSDLALDDIPDRWSITLLKLAKEDPSKFLDQYNKVLSKLLDGEEDEGETDASHDDLGDEFDEVMKRIGLGDCVEQGSNGVLE